MFLEQICPGQVNSHLHAIHTFIYKNDRYIVKFSILVINLKLNSFIQDLCHRF